MKGPVAAAPQLLHLGFLSFVLWVPQCAQRLDEGAAPGGGGEGGNPSARASQADGEAGDTFGSTLICGKRTIISECDPFDLVACGSGQVCDFVPEFGGFKCYDNTEAAGYGEACDDRTTKCGPGLGCELFAVLKCQHYCCEDSDCDVGPCYTGFNEDGEATIGRCLDEVGGICFAGLDPPPEECLEPSGSAGAGGSAP